MPQILKRVKPLSFFLFFFLLIPHLSFSATLRELYESATESYNKGEYDQSIETFQKITKDTPQFAPAYIGLGLALKAKGADIEEVLYYYKLAVEKDPANSQALEQLGRLYYSLGQMDKAKNAFDKALKINPNLPAVKQILGWIYLVGKNANPGRAALYFEDVIKTAPSPNVYFGLGMAYFSSNQREKVLDIITQLKGMGQDEYAERLEKAVRENRKVILSEQPSDPSEDQGDNKSKDDFEKTSNNPKGIKVRLRGKLDQL